MESITFKKGFGGIGLVHGNRQVSIITYHTKLDGKLYVYAEGDPSNEVPVEDLTIGLKDIRVFFSDKGWVEFSVEIKTSQELKCECGARHTSNPNLHSALMPCPLYGRGA